MEDTIIMDSVLQKYFAGETSDLEEKYILEWLEESEEHRKYFFELKSLWNARNVFTESSDLTRFAAFMHGIDRRIRKIDTARRRGRLLRWSLGTARPSCLLCAQGRHGISSPRPASTVFTRTTRRP